MKKVFLSLPMHGKSDLEIRNEINYLKSDEIKQKLEIELNDDIEYIDNFDATGTESDGRLYYLGQAIQKLDKCDAILFASNWESAKGCKIEYDVAIMYRIKVITLDYLLSHKENYIGDGARIYWKG